MFHFIIGLNLLQQIKQHLFKASGHTVLTVRSRAVFTIQEFIELTFRAVQQQIKGLMLIDVLKIKMRKHIYISFKPQVHVRRK